MVVLGNSLGIVKGGACSLYEENTVRIRKKMQLNSVCICWVASLCQMLQEAVGAQGEFRETSDS